MTGLRREIRCALYQSHRYDLGCPMSGVCTLFAPFGRTTPCGPTNGCKNFVGPVEDDPDPIIARRLQYLTRIESLVNVGCKFAPNDLDPRTWTELITLALERERIRAIIDKGRMAKNERGPKPEDEAALRKVRKEAGTPESGGPLFPRQQPMK